MQFTASGETMLVVDESNLVKNHKAIRSQRIISIAQQCKYRVLLNGTPISKNEKDLFSQWYLLDWRILGYQSFWSFAANHLEYDPDRPGRIRRVLHIDYLTDKIAPYSFLVKREDCMTLPEKRIIRHWFDMPRRQWYHYDNVKEIFLSSLLMDEEHIGPAAIYRTFTALQDVTSGRRITSGVDEAIRHEPMYKDVYDNPRIEALLAELDGCDEKTVVWCRFSHEIEDVARVLRSEYGEASVVQFYGKMNTKARNAARESFEGDAQFFVANKVCAGYGLNLQFCHRAIYYNNDWDWATRAQSEDRLHRLGQENEVQITDLYCQDTIDGRILDCLDRKERLVDRFRENVKSKNIRKWMDGGSEDDTNRSEQSAERHGRERVCKASRNQESGRVLAASLSD
jgi:SNF2 family DNA or RNA helicase